jgi:uncharacterized protein HemY
LSIDRNHANARQFLANHYQNMTIYLVSARDVSPENVNRAIGLAHKAIALNLDPQSGGPWFSLGMASYRAGKWRNAITALEKSMKPNVKADDRCDWLLMALALWQVGEKQEARRWHEKALKDMAKRRRTVDEENFFRDFGVEVQELLGSKPSPPLDNPKN